MIFQKSEHFGLTHLEASSQTRHSSGTYLIFSNSNIYKKASNSIFWCFHKSQTVIPAASFTSKWFVASEHCCVSGHLYIPKIHSKIGHLLSSPLEYSEEMGWYMLHFEIAHIFVTVFLCAKNCHKDNKVTRLQIPQETTAVMAHLSGQIPSGEMEHWYWRTWSGLDWRTNSWRHDSIDWVRVH